MNLQTGRVHEVGAADFNRLIRTTSMPLLLYIWAPWCPPCIPMGPAYGAAAAANPEVVFLKLNAATDSQLLTALNVASVPTLLLHDQNGEQIARFTGALSTPLLADWLQRHLQ